LPLGCWRFCFNRRLSVNEKLVTIDRAEAVSGINRRTIRRRIAAGELPAVIDPRDRRRKLIRTTDLRKYLGEVGLQKVA
jgi:hypothetical protein